MSGVSRGPRPFVTRRWSFWFRHVHRCRVPKGVPPDTVNSSYRRLHYIYTGPSKSVVDKGITDVTRPRQRRGPQVSTCYGVSRDGWVDAVESVGLVTVDLDGREGTVT